MKDRTDKMIKYYEDQQHPALENFKKLIGALDLKLVKASRIKTVKQ